MNRWETPLGSFDVEIGRDGVSNLQMSDGVKFPPVEGEFAEALNSHLRGKPASLKLDVQGLKPIAQVTLAKLLEIPYGEVRSYAWVAREIGRPTAIRAVASAVARNPLPILIPCHRVVRSDGTIGQYSFGDPGTKRELLEFEGLDVDLLEQLARRGTRYVSEEEMHEFHVPSCHSGPALDSPKIIELKDVEAAVERHLHPCRRCRPIELHR